MPSDFLFLILFLSPQCPTQDPHSCFKIRPPLGCWTLLFWAFFISASLHAHPCMLVSLSSISGPLPSVRLWRGCHTHFRALYHWRIPSLPWQLLSLISRHAVDSGVPQAHPTQPTPKGAHRCPSTTDFWSAARLGLLSLLLGCPSRGFRAPP